MTPMPTDLMIGLRDVFATYFDTEGLTDFALALGIDFENLSGSTKSAKARELALYIWRHSKLPNLAEVGPVQRPDIDWARILGPHVPLTDPAIIETGGTTSSELDYRDLQTLVPILAAYPDFQTPGGRKTVLTLAGVDQITNVDLNGSSRQVAGNVLVQLNDYGQTREGDSALGRLIRYLLDDETLPTTHRDIILQAVSTSSGLIQRREQDG